MRIALPEFCLIILKGAPLPLLSAFAERHFASDAIVNEQALDAEIVLGQRLAHRKLVALPFSGSAQIAQSDALALAKKYHAAAFSIDLSAHGEATDCVSHHDKAHRFHAIYDVPREVALESVAIDLHRIPGDKRDETGGFDIVGDVHGCADELEDLLGALGYRLDWTNGATKDVRITPPRGRRLVLAGDLVDRGPRTPDVLRIAMAACEQGVGFCVPGNHDAKFLRWMLGRDVKLNHGLGQSAEQMALETQDFHDRVRTFISGLDLYFWCDEGRLLISHAGIREDFIGRLSKRIRRFCLYGDTSGEKDETGLPIRYHWAAHYQGPVTLVYGHTPVATADWVNNTLCVDTGCCFGGKLTALRWPEREILSVPARAQYTPPRRPFGHPPIRPARPI